MKTTTAAVAGNLPQTNDARAHSTFWRLPSTARRSPVGGPPADAHWLRAARRHRRRRSHRMSRFLLRRRKRRSSLFRRWSTRALEKLKRPIVAAYIRPFEHSQGAKKRRFAVATPFRFYFFALQLLNSKIGACRAAATKKTNAR